MRQESLREWRERPWVQDIYPRFGAAAGGNPVPLPDGRRGQPYLLAELDQVSRRERLDPYVEALQWVMDRHER